MMKGGIPGQSKLCDHINHLIKDERFPHTTLLAGPEGFPLLALGLATAQDIILHSLEGNARHEGAVNRMDSMVHPDVHFSFPIKGSKEGSDYFLSTFRSLAAAHPYMDMDKWANEISGVSGSLSINVVECTAIQHKLALKSYEGGAKILIVWGAEFLGTNGNRLLKLFEEPPPNTFILLLSEKPEMILPTVLSRCQMFKASPLSHQDVRDWLIKVEDVPPSHADEIAARSEGNIQLALNLISKDEGNMPFSLIDWMEAISASDFDSVLSMSDIFKSMDKESQRYFLTSALVKLRHAYFLDISERRIFEDLIGDQFDLGFVDFMNSQLGEMLNGLDRNAHSAMTFTANSISIWKWMKSKKNANKQV